MPDDKTKAERFRSSEVRFPFLSLRLLFSIAHENYALTRP